MKDFEHLLEKAVADGVVIGAVVCAKGNVNYSNVFGNRAIRPKAEPMTQDTVFVLASMTKLMTSIAVLQLVERGIVAMDDDIAPLLPVLARQPILTGFKENGTPVTKDRKGPITLRHLLTHSVGGSYEFSSGDISQWKKIQGTLGKPGTTVDEVFGHPLLYEPGESWSYGSASDWAGKVVEKLSGLSLEEYMKRHIWAPLGLENITFWPGTNPDMAKRLCSMSIRDTRSGKAVQSRKLIPMTPGAREAFGGQGAYATMGDYTEILNSLLTDDERLLKRETAATMFQPQLSGGPQKALDEAFSNPQWAVGYYPPGAYNWCLGGLLVEGKTEASWRKPGTMLWGGAINSAWFIDRATGVCGVFGSNLLPSADPQIEVLMTGFEEEIYKKAAKERPKTHL
ncbi:beta-lactamase/transpeptidase-like protein [Apiospora kogelbergensis]|uniref:beta-lactamase/transpeptidase-like protein n=1 Tax=Apiospora kogelbergensis TaxID=1337665 RepID=UPI0031309B34